ncbi:unnamed protein product [Alternaria alternata]
MVLFTKVRDTFVHSALTANTSIRDRITLNETKTKTTLNSGTYWHNALRVEAVDAEEGQKVEEIDQSACGRHGEDERVHIGKALHAEKMVSSAGTRNLLSLFRKFNLKQRVIENEVCMA